jgi:hypothetical protein
MSGSVSSSPQVYALLAGVTVKSYFAAVDRSELATTPESMTATTTPLPSGTQ